MREGEIKKEREKEGDEEETSDGKRKRAEAVDTGWSPGSI